MEGYNETYSQGESIHEYLLENKSMTLDANNKTDILALYKMYIHGWICAKSQGEIKIFRGNERKALKYLTQMCKSEQGRNGKIFLDGSKISKPTETLIEVWNECRDGVDIDSWDDRVELRESTIRGAGNGVFATRDIKAQELVCMYPCHWRQLEFLKGDKAPMRDCHPELYWDEPEYWADLPEEHPARQQPITHEHSHHGFKCNQVRTNVDDYQLTILMTPEYILSAGSDPTRRPMNKYLGAFLNDNGYRPGEEYLSHAANNCIFSSPGEQMVGVSEDYISPLCIVAARDIKAGDECFLTYGPQYWVNR
jgi:hypothetical protein